MKKKIIRSDKNLGFRTRDPESKYVLLLNNDAVIRRDGLNRLVEYAENNSSVDLVQRVVLKLGSSLIDTVGDYVTEVLHTIPAGEGRLTHGSLGDYSTYRTPMEPVFYIE
mgnify:CR=1 FL=1